MNLPFGLESFDLVTLITTLEFLPEPTLALAEAARVARRGLVLGVINRESHIGRDYQRQGAPPWQSAQFYTPSELVRMIHKARLSSHRPFWRTTLWRVFPWGLPLPWGGFIGMGLRLEQAGRHPS